ncbi:MAG TPA: hypothetical protein VEX65_12280 [Flavisolibacter sp.]|nr:hypothetical protein [Flavisolibacter sp.]
MRILSSLAILSVLFIATSCGDNNGTGKTFCDTACNTDSLNFKGDHRWNPTVDIGLNACKGDTLMWMHDYSGSHMLSMRQDLGQEVYLNKSAIDCYIKDTSYAWLQFNDCKTGRGYLLKLPFNLSEERRKISGAFTRFDPKFKVDPDLIVYTDRGSVFVENRKTEQKASLSFDKPYDIDFNKIHEMVDSIHVTKERIFLQMIREGKTMPYEKKISL